MDISSFLTVIVFCFLLVMDYEPAAESARIMLGVALGTLADTLVALPQTFAVGIIAEPIDEKRITALADKVKDIREKNSNKKGYRKRWYRKLEVQVKKIQRSVDKSIRSSQSSGSYGDLNAFLDHTEKSWSQVEKEFLEK
jgi:hypothetical protein